MGWYGLTEVCRNVMQWMSDDRITSSYINTALFGDRTSLMTRRGGSWNAWVWEDKSSDNSQPIKLGSVQLAFDMQVGSFASCCLVKCIWSISDGIGMH